MEEEAVRVGGNAVDLVVGRHKAKDANINRFFEGWEILLAERANGDVHWRQIETIDRVASSDEMFGGCQSLLWAPEVTLLNALDHSNTHLGNEERILTKSFAHSSPPCIARNIDIRRKRPLRSVGSHFTRRFNVRLSYQFEIPTARHRQRCGIDGATSNQTVAVNRIDSNDQRNPKTTFAHFRAYIF